LGPTVTITAQRAALEPKVTAFVNKIGGSIYEEGIARWHNDVCPLVSGLPAQEGEFILGRLSEIARDTNIPLGKEKCRPNFYILVNEKPAALLRLMDKRNHPYTFGQASPNLIDQFISTPKPVRVWYHTVALSQDGLPMKALAFPNFEVMAGGINGDVAKQHQLGNAGGCNTCGQVGPQGGESGPLVPTPGITDLTGIPSQASGTATHAIDTHLSYNVVWNLYRVFVIIDMTRLQGLSREQVADYAAMVGFAELTGAIPPEDDPTILRLFETPPHAAASGLTDWDQAFLKSLYRIEQTSKLQRSQIAASMVRQIVP